jgi:hypothetical protein
MIFFVLACLWLVDAAHLTWALKLLLWKSDKYSAGEVSRGPSLWSGF